MHQSVVTTVPMQVNSGNIDFSLCKARVYAKHCGNIFMIKDLPKTLLKSRQALNGKLPKPVWTWNQKPRGSTAVTVGTNLRSNHGIKPGSPVTNDWCGSDGIYCFMTKDGDSKFSFCKITFTLYQTVTYRARSFRPLLARSRST